MRSVNKNCTKHGCTTMTKYKDATIIVAEGLSIKKTSASSKYQYHYRINGKVHRRSTKTGDKRQAKQIAIDARNTTLYELKNGILSDTISFNELKKRYLKTLTGENKLNFHEGTIRRHLSPFFYKIVDITKIKHEHLDEYLQYRKSKSGTITNGTLNKENAVFNQMMLFALDRDYLSKRIKLKRAKETANPRPHFTDGQFKTLKKTARLRINEVKNKKYMGQSRGLYQQKLWSRELIYDLIIFAVATGVRPCELKTIKWKDINWTDKSVKLDIAGKKDSNRTLYITRKDGIEALNRIKDRRLSYIASNDQLFREEDKVQSLPNGRSSQNMKKSFRSLISSCGFEYDYGRQRHSMYSLRHTYATRALSGFYGKKPPIQGIAKQMGTSIEMIEKHYGHDGIDDYKDDLMN